MKVVFLGTVGFPHGMAEVEKQKLLAKSIVHAGSASKIICNKSFNKGLDLPYKGSFEGVEYLYTSFSINRRSNRLFNKLMNIVGLIYEKLYLIFGRYDTVIISSRNFWEVKWNEMIVHFRSKKIFITHVEDLKSLYSNANPKQMNRIRLFEEKVWNIVDGAFPISEELTSQIRKYNTQIPILKIPVLVDVEYSQKVKDLEFQVKTPYFMFCGSVDYETTIRFIIKGYSDSNVSAQLILVIPGAENKRAQIKDYIASLGYKEEIIILPYISKETLWNYYQNAVGLLIPLNFDIRDKARFPHKIGEYASCRVPIISSDWGEVKEYFKHGESAYLIKENSSFELAKALTFLETNDTFRNTISDGAFQLALSSFDYRIYGERLINFVNSCSSETR